MKKIFAAEIALATTLVGGVVGLNTYEGIKSDQASSKVPKTTSTEASQSALRSEVQSIEQKDATKIGGTAINAYPMFKAAEMNETKHGLVGGNMHLAQSAPDAAATTSNLYDLALDKSPATNVTSDYYSADVTVASSNPLRVTEVVLDHHAYTFKTDALGNYVRDAKGELVTTSSEETALNLDFQDGQWTGQELDPGSKISTSPTTPAEAHVFIGKMDGLLSEMGIKVQQ